MATDTQQPRRITDSRADMQTTVQAQSEVPLSVEDYVKQETDRILANSTKINDDEIVDIVLDKGQWRAITRDGNKGPRRNTKEEASAATIEHFQLGQKVAETVEQKEQLLALATELRQFGGRRVSLKTAIDVVEKALPNATDSYAFKLTANIRPAVQWSSDRKMPYTSYGKELSIQWESNRNGGYDAAIYSPEGVKLTIANFEPEELITFGLSKDVMVAAWNKGIELNTGATNVYSTPDLYMSGNPFMDALSQNLNSQEYLDLIRRQSQLPGGGTITSRGKTKTFRYEQDIQQDGIYEGFGYYPYQPNEALTREQYNSQRMAEFNKRLVGSDLYAAVFEGSDFRPSWNINTYLQTLNTAYSTPSNNINFGENGLQYTFSDGSSVSFGSQLGNYNFFNAINNLPITRPEQGLLFNTLKDFNSSEEYQSWKSTQDQTQAALGRVTTSTTTPQTPTVTPPTTDFQSNQPVQPPSYGQQPVAQQPVAPPTQTVTTPTGIQTPTGITGTTFPQTQTPGTFQVPSVTAGFGAVPGSVPTTPGVAGFTPTQLTSTVPGVQDPNTVGVRTVNYTNQMGQMIPVTESNGKPITYVPPGFTRTAGAAEGGLMVKGYQEGGSVEDTKTDAMYRMATKFLGYRGPRSRKALEDFAKSSPAVASKMRAYITAMAKGGMVRKGYQAGGAVTQDQLSGMSGNLIRQTLQPMQAPVEMMQPTEMDFIPTTAGQAAPVAPAAQVATVPQITQANMPNVVTPASFQAQAVTPQIQEAMQQLQPAQMQLAPQAQVQAAQQQGTSVSGIEAAQGTAIMMDNPMQREIQQGELISGTTVDATKIEELNNQIQAAQATPTKQATVQGQLEGLMAQFEGGATPAWAAGAMRNAMATLSARGLGASSLAGQAVVQAAMESAMPIAQIDAQTRAQFEAQNLSNRQQTAMMAAQQRATFLQMEFDQEFQSRVQNASRIADIANMNFTAEQQVALENSRMANTTNLQNLTNRQAKVMAEAAALANLDMANLNNRQQAAVQNAQNFLQVDLTNLNNEQQTALFKSQQNAQALFTDQAAQNAAQQFNAASENQTNQFFASLATQVSQFNATQQNALEQFNVNSTNAMRQFNSEVQQQRDLFNAQNGLVIAQANAQWRQNIATLNTAAQNQSNMEFARTINALTSTNLDQIWQRERDIMSYAFTQSESAMDRALNILLADKELDAYREKMAADESNARAAFGTSVLLEWMK